MFKRINNIPPLIMFRELWRYAEGQRGRLILYVLMSAAAMLTELCVPVPIARLMDSLQTLSGQALINEVYLDMGIFALLEVLFWAFHGPSRCMEQGIAFKTLNVYQDTLFRKVTLLPMRWHKDHHSGETIDQVRKANDALRNFGENVFEVVQLSTRFIGSLIILSCFMPYAGLAVLAVSAIVVNIVIVFDRRLSDQYRRINKQFNAVAASIQDYLTNISTIISLRLEDRVAREVDHRTSRIFPLYRANVWLNETKWFTTAIFVRGTQAGVLLAYCLIEANSGGTILVGTFFALYRYMGQIGESFFQVTYKYSQLLRQSTAVEGIRHIEASHESHARERPGDQLPANWSNIEIEDLTFSHNDNDGTSIPQLREISFQLERGKRYAFVGESGSGKSTTLGVIRGLHHADQVTVFCDGKALPHGLAAVGHNTTLIPQDPEIFSETIRFNISMGIETDDQKLIEAARSARFESVLTRLPKGLDTNIAEKGVNLSGGEKQRLALARGIFFARESESHLILLDEPTSSVDAFNERIIYENLMKEFPDRCIVSALHKFHLLDLFDEVLFFDRGIIAQRGTKDELLNNEGEFTRLWRNSMERKPSKAKVP